MFDISKRLLYYKRREVQDYLVSASMDREVGIRYGDRGYGKRPDILMYPNDVLEAVKKGATSFHVSEEHWNNPLDLSTEMSRKDQDELRKGWDLVLDIDCPHWFYSKLTAYLFIKSLEQHDIKAISCKFSGNKGFHIGVPFESFPSEINGMPIKDWFPEGPKKIALYLLDYISKNLITVSNGEIKFGNVHTTTINQIAEATDNAREDIIKYVCSNCNKTLKANKAEQEAEFICPKCDTRIFNKMDHQVCPKCNFLMDKKVYKRKICSCKTELAPKEVFDALSIIEVDTILISSRHMYRAPYSMHEKSGLVSIAISPETILEFEKHMAEPDKVQIDSLPKFLDGNLANPNESMKLMTAAFDFGKEDIRFKSIIDENNMEKKSLAKYETLTSAIPAEYFPPCMLKILEGLGDGRKRSLFILVNFLRSAGWGYLEAEEFLNEWNKKNRPPLKDRDIPFQISYHKQKGKNVLPPNCRAYYQDFRVCFPDAVCERIKNPVQYAKRRAFALLKKKPRRSNLTEEQKAMRKEHREKLKKLKIKEIKHETKKKRA
ncbi:MAG: hypothetical protein ABIJ34_00300 [archaeon]